jgi:hypothetical protein
MPAPTRSLTLDAVHEFVHDQIFTPGGAGRVGIELEWFPPPRTAPDTLRDLLPGALPGGGAVTFEPGGQLELSGPPRHGIADACTHMRVDTAAARAAFTTHGISSRASDSTLAARAPVSSMPRGTAPWRCTSTPVGRWGAR